MPNPIAVLAGLLMPLIWVSYQQALPETKTTVYIAIGLCSLVLILGLLNHRCRAGTINAKTVSPLIVLAMCFSTATLCGWLRANSVAAEKLDQQLEASLEGIDLVVSGRIDSIGASTQRATRFEFKVDSIRTDHHRLPKRLRLSWYSSRQKAPPILRAGERWQLTVRLKRFHTALSPAAFDLEGWAFRRGFGAQGYVRDGKRVGDTLAPERSVRSTPRAHVGQFLIQQIEDPVAGGLIRALAVGDRTGLSAATWQTLRRTGTNHLMAISGLHVGLAALWGSVLMGILWRHCVVLMRRCSLADLQTTSAIVAGTGYALLAGMALPTQRAVLMLAVFTLARLLKRHLRGDRVIIIALVLILSLDPLAINEPGLWLSFLAVVALWLGARSVRSILADGKPNPALHKRVLRVVAQWFRLQIILTVCLTPVLITLFNEISLISVPVNLIAIPVMAFLIVPVVLSGVVVLLLGVPTVAGLLFELAAGIVQPLWKLLEWSADLPLATWSRATPEVFVLVLASIGVLGFLLPVDLRGRRWLLLAWLPLLVAPASDLADDEIEVAVLDVGQGLSVVVRSPRRTLVFDTGIAYPSGGSAVQSVVAPYLMSHGVRRLQRVLISHPDSDHAGGLPELGRRFPIERLLVGPEVMVANAGRCTSGVRWHWRHTQFSILAPDGDLGGLSGNNASCVLRIDHGAVSVLLTGDIEAEAERRLVQQFGSQLESKVLVLGHHGSKTSSTQSFLETVRPEIAVVSAGYRNRHGHPAEEVLVRTQNLGISVERTDQSGTIAFRIKPADYKILRFREILRRYWHHS